MEEQQKLVKKSLEDQAEALTEIQVEQVVEMQNKAHTVKNSLEVTNSSIKQTQMTSVNGYRGDEYQKRAHTRRRNRVNLNEHRDWCAI